MKQGKLKIAIYFFLFDLIANYVRVKKLRNDLMSLGELTAAATDYAIYAIENNETLYNSCKELVMVIDEWKMLVNVGYSSILTPLVFEWFVVAEIEGW